MKKTKKLLSSVLALAVIAASFTVGMIAYAGSPVAINATNFPDANFRTIVAMECDEDGDGYLSDEEIAGVTLFSVTGYLYDLDEDAVIEDLTGIEKFTNLKTLRCGGIGLTSLDVTKLTKLTELTCSGNEIGTLDVSKNTLLRTLRCASDDLSALNVSMLPSLVTLDCSVNSISQLSVSANTALETLNVGQNELSELNLNSNTALRSLHCNNNHLQELDLSSNTALSNVTSNRIGNQTISGEAVESEGSAYVTMPFNDKTRIISTSLDDPDDTLGLIGYQGSSFVANDFTLLLNGIDYEYDTGLDGAEPMTVHINVTRDFFIVRFYTNEQKTTLISQEVVDRGHDASAPAVTDTPQCKTFVAWSDTFSDIQSDKDIYATWKDDHVFRVVGFDNNNISLECLNGCGTNTTVSFFDYVGAEYGDSNYNDAFDLNADGIINGKDLAYLKKGQF